MPAITTKHQEHSYRRRDAHRSARPRQGGRIERSAYGRSKEILNRRSERLVGFPEHAQPHRGWRHGLAQVGRREGRRWATAGACAGSAARRRSCGIWSCQVARACVPTPCAAGECKAAREQCSVRTSVVVFKARDIDFRGVRLRMPKKRAASCSWSRRNRGAPLPRPRRIRSRRPSIAYLSRHRWVGTRWTCSSSKRALRRRASGIRPHSTRQ